MVVKAKHFDQVSAPFSVRPRTEPSASARWRPKSSYIGPSGIVLVEHSSRAVVGNTAALKLVGIVRGTETVANPSASDQIRLDPTIWSKRFELKFMTILLLQRLENTRETS